MAAQFAADLEAVFPRQHDVEQDEIEGTLAGPLGCGQAIGDALDLVTFHAEIVFEAESDARFVFDDQDATHGLTTAGRSMVKVLPWPGSLSTVISPPWASTICRTMASPTPEPLTLREAAALPRTNLRKMTLRSEAGMPMPLSR